MQGEIVFRNSSDSALMSPQIAPQWMVSPQEADPEAEFTHYARVSREPAVLSRISEIIARENDDLSSFEPHLAAILTWHNNVSRNVNVPVSSGNNVLHVKDFPFLVPLKGDTADYFVD